MIGLHQLQPRNIHIQIHLFFYTGIAGTQRLDFSIRKRGFVHVITGTNRAFVGHDLRDKFLFVFDRLPEVGVKGGLCHIPIDEHFFIAVALTDDTTRTLLQITRTPGTIQIMLGDEPVLNIGARAHFSGTAHEHAHLTRTNLSEQFLLFYLRIRIMDECDFFLWDALRDQLGPDVVIDVEFRHLVV